MGIRTFVTIRSMKLYVELVDTFYYHVGENKIIFI